MTESEQIDQILSDIVGGAYIYTSMDTPDLYRSAVHKMKAYGLIVPRGNTYDLTKEGHEAYEGGGFDKWKVLIAKQKADRQASINVGGSAIIGNNNSGNNQGRDFVALPTAQPIGNPNTNPPTIDTKDNGKMSISIAQFIAWLMATFIGGVSIGFAVANNLHK